MKILFAIVILLSSIVNAAETTTAAKNYQTLDLKQFDSLKDQSTVKVKVGMSCKSDSGLEYKAGDMGYEQCVKASSKNNQSKDSSQSQNNGAGNTGTMEVTF